ncbi:Rid family detoxifying hydrolase [Enterococcus dongliensis]|uniref:Rid family detoxifying hydrolase n=1 Tax=Enterococcus dongliensis TaxID=2559925 RepID=UPI00289075D1|nr:Rid family detoxifying hydrolase [Enterococcus dongliensis]MDT2640740.1 Rid family detoxifying hydrolase [Enterococcus dongliensis]
MENNVTKVNFQVPAVYTVETSKAPQAIGPYVQGKIVKGMLYASGQIALNPENGELVGDSIEDQTYQVLRNVGGILAAAGVGYDQVVKTTCFLKNISDFAAFNQVYESFFDNEKPSRSCVGVADLPKGALVEVEVAAVVE